MGIPKRTLTPVKKMTPQQYQAFLRQQVNEICSDTDRFFRENSGKDNYHTFIEHIATNDVRMLNNVCSCMKQPPIQSTADC